MSPTNILRIIRTALQALVSLAASVPLAWFHVLPTGWLAILSAGLVVAVSVLHNATSFLNFIDKFIPAKYQSDVTGIEDVVAQLAALAQSLEHNAAPTAAATVPVRTPMSAGYVKPAPAPDIAGQDVLKKV